MNKHDEVLNELRKYSQIGCSLLAKKINWSKSSTHNALRALERRGLALQNPNYRWWEPVRVLLKPSPGSDKTQITRVLEALTQHNKPIDRLDLALKLKMIPASTSACLSQLKQAGLIENNRHGLWWIKQTTKTDATKIIDELGPQLNGWAVVEIKALVPTIRLPDKLSMKELADQAIECVYKVRPPTDGEVETKVGFTKK